VRSARAALASGDPETASIAVHLAASDLDRAAAKGVIHTKNAARRKGRLMKQLAALVKG
jgi:small subunit ribosomal protein S20